MIVMVHGLFFRYNRMVLIAICITKIFCTLIKEKGKINRIEKLKDLNDSTIESIGEYEKSLAFGIVSKRASRFLML